MCAKSHFFMLVIANQNFSIYKHKDDFAFEHHRWESLVRRCSMGAKKDSADNAKESEVDLDPDLNETPDSDFELDETSALSAGTENVGETSVEIDIEELIAEFEDDNGHKSGGQDDSTRKRLEELLEQKRVAHELEELDEFDTISAD